MSRKTFEKVVIVKSKRPVGATPDKARQLKAEGVKVAEIAERWGISSTRVYAILKQP